MADTAASGQADIAARPRGHFLARLAIGLAQGAALYCLYRAFDAQAWPATNGLIFAPLLLVFLFVPLVLVQGLGEMRLRTLIVWAIAAAAILAALGWYDIWSAWPQDYTYGRDGRYAWRPHVLPSFGLFVFVAAGLFIAHALIASGDADRKFMALYTTHFDVAWKLGVQLALSVCFVGAFWLLLWLGAALFNLIKLDFFERLIEHQWFSIPATTLATAAALHLTDVQPALVRGTRTLVLLLLSWLLPLLTLIVAGFLISLVFTGLNPLWKIGHASALLLIAAAILIILINAAHQDGAPERAPPALLRIAGSLAAVMLVPIVGLAAHAIFLRVSQYGWTQDRVATAACVIVAGCYAIGYVIATAPAGGWLRRIETWNFCTALLILAVLLALFSPIADPKRISVADQVSRLNSGKAKPGSFDFAYLRWEGGRYGQDALTKLSRSPNSQVVRQAADRALKATNRYSAVPATPIELAAKLTVYPRGRSLPQSFLHQKWDSSPHHWNDCLNDGFAPGSLICEAFLIDLDGDNLPEIIVAQHYTGASIWSAVLAKADKEGRWSIVGRINGQLCASTLDALRAGKFQIVAPEPSLWRDLALAGGRLHVEADIAETPACPTLH